MYSSTCTVPVPVPVPVPQSFFFIVILDDFFKRPLPADYYYQQCPYVPRADRINLKCNIVLELRMNCRCIIFATSTGTTIFFFFIVILDDFFKRPLLADYYYQQCPLCSESRSNKFKMQYRIGTANELLVYTDLYHRRKFTSKYIWYY